VAGIVARDLYVGSLGLRPRRVNFTDFNSDTSLSLLGALRAVRRVPSMSWSYKAGSCSHEPPVFGSLVLGGYDAARFVPNNVSFAFCADISSDFVSGAAGNQV
jgi:hypothetical protein